jgi:hypothetical protein
MYVCNVSNISVTLWLNPFYDSGRRIRRSRNSLRTRTFGLPSRCASRCWNLPSRSCVYSRTHVQSSSATGRSVLVPDRGSPRLSENQENQFLSDTWIFETSILKNKNPKKIHRLPHVRRTCGCTVNFTSQPHVRCGILCRTCVCCKNLSSPTRRNLFPDKIVKHSCCLF